MFIQKESGSVFIKSKNVNAFPCGRRRGIIDKTEAVDAYIPFDPEARLNTEANNRRHSGLNGFKQSYLKWTDNGFLTLVIEGYLFTINLRYASNDNSVQEDYSNPYLLGSKLEEFLSFGGGKLITEIYANIRLANVKFFDGTNTVKELATQILRDQTPSAEPESCLDLFIDETGSGTENADNYYFSGLSFSDKPLGNNIDVFSLQILEKVNDAWVIKERSKLPKIDHGSTRDSVLIKGDLVVDKAVDAEDNMVANGNLNIAGDLAVVNSITANTLDVLNLKQGGHTAAMLDIKPVQDSGGNFVYRLCFTGAVEQQQ